MADTLPEPKSRKEEYLATAAGMTGITLPEPASREEIYLNAIAEGGGGGGGGSDINVVQTTGTSTTDVMSQKAVTDALADAGGPTVVQTTGTSTTDVMSQKAVTDALAGAGGDTNFIVLTDDKQTNKQTNKQSHTTQSSISKQKREK